MTSIAIFGTSGCLGPAVLKELQDSKYDGKIQYPVKAITTQDKSKESNDKIQFIQGTISDPSNDLATQLKGTDIIISLTGPKPEILSGLETLIKAVKPKIYIPSEFGCENDKIPAEESHPGNSIKTDHTNKVKHDTKVVSIYNGFFRIPPIFLYGFVNHIGIDKEKKTVTYVGSEDCAFPFSTGVDIAKTIGYICTVDPSKVLPAYRIYSGMKKVKEVVEEAEKETGSKFDSKVISAQEAKDSYLKTVKAGEPDFIGFLFSVAFAGPGKGVEFAQNEREVVNPGESSWKWSSW